MIEIEESCGNVYANLGMRDAEEMLVKAQLATKIGEIIKSRRWTQQEAAEVLGLTQPKLSNMLRGQFRGISESKMLDCLVRLGRDVQIVVSSGSQRKSAGHIAVVFTA
ncbi:helix-turn-helix domain-containing protein [Glaciimonas sp. GG7]